MLVIMKETAIFIIVQYVKRSFLFILLFIAAQAAVPGLSFSETLHKRSLALLEKKLKTTDPDFFSFVVLGDSRDNDKMFKKALRWSAALKPLFILHGGDITDSGTKFEMNRFISLISDAAPDVPVFVVRGNHERDLRLFEEKIGPRQFSIDLPALKTVVTVVDNTDYELSAESLSYIKKTYKSRHNFNFIMMHIPPRVSNWQWHTFYEGASELLTFLAMNKPSAIFFSHVHQYARDDSRDYPMIITGGAGAPLYAKSKFPGEPVYHIIHVRVRNGVVTADMIPLE